MSAVLAFPAVRPAAVVAPPDHHRVPATPVVTPELSTLVAWRREADARLELALSEFDAAMMFDAPPQAPARRAIDSMSKWLRGSLKSLGAPAPVDPEAVAWQGRIEGWEARSAEIVDQLVAAPERLEHYLRVQLALTFEAAARGYAGHLSA